MLEANHGETGTTSESTGRFAETVRVLVVDHGHGLGAMAHDLLARSVGHSFELQTTDSVSAAERIAAQVQPVLILIDGSFGLEAWRSLVDPSRHPDHGVVVLFNRHNPRPKRKPGRPEPSIAWCFRTTSSRCSRTPCVALLFSGMQMRVVAVTGAA